MTEDGNNSSRGRVYRQALVGLAVLAVFVATAWYLTSAGFREWVRQRIVTNIEQATGGRVELREVAWSISRLRLEMRDLTIHGLESPNEIPFVHANRVLLRGKILSFFRRKLAVRYVELDKVVVHLIINPDGTTNQPTPRSGPSSKSPVQTVFELSANKAVVKDSQFILNDRPVPLDMDASDVAASATYASALKRYDGNIHIGKIDSKFPDLRPFSAIADAEFTLSPNAAELKSLQVSSGNSRFDISGKVDDFNRPNIAFTYRGTFDLAQGGSIFRAQQLRGGLLRLVGGGAYNSSGYQSSGKLSISGLEWDEPSVQIRNLSLGGEFTLDRSRIVIPRLTVNAMGGLANGDAEVTNWLPQTGVTVVRNAAQSKRSGSNLSLPDQRGAIRLRVRGLELSAIAAAFSSRSLPLEQLRLAGKTDGTLAATWRGSPANARTELDLTVTAPTQLAPGQVPANADFRGVYNAAANTLDIAKSSLSTPATRVTASGTLGITAAHLSLSASTTDLGELKPLLVAGGHSEPLPLDVHGRASFEGTVAGKFSAPEIAGHLQLTDFESVFAPPDLATATVAEHSVKAQTLPSSVATSPKPVRRIHWDSLATDLRYSPETLVFRNAVLRRGTAQVNFDVSADLRRAPFTGNTPVTAHANIRNAQLSDLQSLAGYNYPIKGNVNSSVQISGTAADPHGNGNLQITSAEFYGQPVARVTSSILFANHQVQLTNLEVAQNQARVTGALAYTLTDRAFRFKLRGTDFNLANLKVLNQDRMHAAGALKFTADGGGTLQEPIINADLSLANLVINGEHVGDISAHAQTTGDTMKISARSNVGDSDLRVEGNVRLRDNFPVSLAVGFKHLDLDPLLTTYLQGRLTGHSYFEGNVDVKGPLRQIRNVDLTGELTQFYVPVENIEIRNQGPIRFAMTQQVLHLQQVHLVAEDTDLSASGTAELSGERRLNLAANGHVNLKIIQGLNPDYTSYGKATIDVKVGGTVNAPHLNGQIQVANAALSYTDLPNGLSDINGTLLFNSDRLQIEKLTGRTGGGTVNMTGYVTYGRTIGFNVQASANDIRLRYPPGVSAMADANVRLTGSLHNSLLSGDVTITRFGLNPRFDFAQYLAHSKQPADVTNPNSPLKDTRLDIHVTSTPELQVQTSLAKLSGNVDMRVRGTAQRPSMLGRVVIVEGDVFFNGTKYHLERGDVTFTNPTRIQPVLDVEASTRVRDYDITLGFHGPTDKLSTTYRSDPPLATADIIALLAFGRTREESALQTVSNQNFTETASNAILGQALNATVSSRVQKLFGVSRIKIDPQVGGAENNPSTARVTIEQQVANDLTVTYITDLARANQQVISVEYNLSRAVSLVAVRDQYGIVSFDIRIRQRKR